MMVAATTTRVNQHTREEFNERIRLETEERVAACAAAGPEAIEQRLNELDQEWDIERVLEMNASSLALGGLLLGATVNRRFFVVPALVCGFLAQHAVQGWCPPINFFRRFGFRTATEIDYERYALKAIRGDFRNLPTGDGRMTAGQTHQLLDAMRR